MAYLIPMQQPMYAAPRQPMQPSGFQIPNSFQAPLMRQPPVFQPPTSRPALSAPVAFQPPISQPRPMPQAFQPPGARLAVAPQAAQNASAPRVPQPSARYTAQDLQQAVSRLGPDAGVTVKQLERYLNVPGEKVNMVQAIARAVTDNAWADELQKAKLKTGDPLTDKLLWQQHWDFVQGRTSQDPLLTKNPKAMEEIAKRVGDMIREYHRTPE